MPASRKRQRGAPSSDLAPLSSESVAALRAALTGRSGEDSCPALWRAAVSAAGLAGADAFLCLLGRSVGEAIRAVPVKAESARTQLRSTRATLRAAVDSRFDELELRIDDAETAKIAALERELCAIDAALERLRAERSAAAGVAASAVDAEIVSKHADLTARLDAAEAQLLDLPTAVVEPSHIGVLVDVPALLASVTVFGRVVAPRSVTAADLSLVSTPRCAYPGTSLRLSLVLESPLHASQSAEELEVSLGATAAATQVVASLETAGAAPQQVGADIFADAAGRCVAVELSIPLSAPAGSSVCVGAVTVSGRPVLRMAQSLSIPVQRGLKAPMMLSLSVDLDASADLCVSRSGEIFVTQFGSPGVQVYSSVGAPLLGMPIAAFGFGAKTPLCATFADGDAPTFIIADDERYSARVVAVDPSSRAVRWATARGAMNNCVGLEALPAHGICLVASAHDYKNTLHALRLVDGERVGSLLVENLEGGLAADRTTGAIFGMINCCEGGPHEVAQLAWTPGTGLTEVGGVKAAGMAGGFRPMAVIPPAPGKRVSHLLVATAGTGALLVLALPALALIHTHALQGMEIWALAADPWGGALAVSDNFGKAVHVLPWPLRGMPVLE